MSTIPKDPDLDELNKRIREYLKYDTILQNYMFVLMVFLLLPVSIGMIIAISIGTTLTSDSSVTLFILGLILAYIGGNRFTKKREEYHVESDEWARFYTYLIHTQLETYLSTKSSGIRKECRKKALKNSKDFLSCIGQRWTIGSLKSVKLYVGNSISNLIENIRYRLIPAIKDGDDELLRKVKDIMYDFFVFSKNLEIKRIEFLNKKMQESLPNRKPLKMGYFSRLSTFLKKHTVLRHSVFVSIIVVVSFVLGYLGWNSGLTKEGSWIVGITIFGILMGIYFGKQPRTSWESVS